MRTSLSYLLGCKSPNQVEVIPPARPCVCLGQLVVKPMGSSGLEVMDPGLKTNILNHFFRPKTEKLLLFLIKCFVKERAAGGKSDCGACQKKYPCSLGKSNTIEYQSPHISLPSQRRQLRAKMWKMTKIWKLRRDKRHENAPQRVKAGRGNFCFFEFNLPLFLWQSPYSSLRGRLLFLVTLLCFGALLFSVIFVRRLTV